MRRKLPIVEIFGPTIQGEGSLAGRQSHFIRLGGCDYRCKWCDTMYAVDPDQVKENVTSMIAENILSVILTLPRIEWVTISGGNPLLFSLAELILILQAADFKVACETQGSILVDPIGVAELDLLTLSPKPPSSGMRTDFGRLVAIAHTVPKERRAFKIVVFDRTDFEYAQDIRSMFPKDDFWITPGTDMSVKSDDCREELLLEHSRTVANWLLDDHTMHDVGVMPQLHTLLWGQERGR